MLIYYFAIKGMFLFGIVRSFVKYDELQKHWLFLSLLYTSGIAFLSWVFILNMNPDTMLRTLEILVAKNFVLGTILPKGPVTPMLCWEIWVAETWLLSIFFFKLLIRFDEGSLFWLLFAIGGVGLLLF